MVRALSDLEKREGVVAEEAVANIADQGDGTYIATYTLPRMGDWLVREHLPQHDFFLFFYSQVYVCVGWWKKKRKKEKEMMKWN